MSKKAYFIEVLSTDKDTVEEFIKEMKLEYTVGFEDHDLKTITILVSDCTSEDAQLIARHEKVVDMHKDFKIQMIY
jgi:hypothetical protein